MKELRVSDNTLWWGNIAFVPSIHGRAAFARETRRLFLSQRFSAVAVELPDSLMEQVIEGVERLPEIHIVSYEETDGTRCFFPIDPCDSIVEAIRLGLREHCEVVCIDCDVDSFERREAILPDPYAVQSIGLARYYLAVEPYLSLPDPGSVDDRRERFMALQLRALMERHSQPILCVLGLSHLQSVARHLAERDNSRDGIDAEREALLQGLPPARVDLNPVAESSLYHLLGELPYITRRWEARRGEVTLEEFEITEELKLMLLAARDRYHGRHGEEYERISTASFQMMLQLLRNLCLREGRLTPMLYEITLAARGFGGNAFALEVIETARRYSEEVDREAWDSDTVDSGNEELVERDDPDLFMINDFDVAADREGEISNLSLAGHEFREKFDGAVEMTEDRIAWDGKFVSAKKRFEDVAKIWKRLKLERRPTRIEKRRWQTAWDPNESCSWEPEDRLVEQFAGRVRQRAITECSVAQERIEEFTTSFKDGLHLRESLRQHHLRKVFVKELPPIRGRVGAVVIIYEKPDAAKFPWRLTWFSEHEWESTLSFYATDYRRQLIGPGIGRAVYGGQLFLYPPRLIKDVWQDPAFDLARDEAERLVFAGLLHSRDGCIAYTAASPPTTRMKAYAARLGRKILFLPLSSFSRSTLQKLRTFHVLNGKPVRGYARQYIR